ncbi:MFS domain-containing protein [Trichonephila clavata]|uniref:MFS domain-containing protein n=1 Tax=Trichonephila clavata TaxID=2740835 RepID=A0A8X6GR70_TRICU|nr:MFS domain-containing protein [Trichonephila clavata]
MVKHDRLNESLHRNESELSCPLRSATSPIAKSQYKGEFDWDSKQQGYILGVGFFGYLIFQVLGGKVADTVGAKLPLVASNILMGIFTFISPFAAWWNIYAILAVQLFRGLTQGFVTPALYRMMSNWFPKHERGLLSTLTVCGYAFGAMIGGVVTGWICDIPGLGWPPAFYFWGKLFDVTSQ